MCKVLLNEELKGIELYFEGKPNTEVRTELKENGFRYNGKKVCWYAKQNEKSIALGEKLSNGTIEAEEVAPVEKHKRNNKIDLWSLVQFDENITNDSSLSRKDIAKEVRSYLKKRFPFVKFSITTKSYSGGGSIDCDIVSSPFAEDSKYLKAIQEYCVKYVNTYNWDDSDIMTDYHHCNFYGGYFQTSWKYEQTEASQEIIEAMKEYDIKEVEAFEKKRQEEIKQYEEYKKQQEIEHQQYLARKEEEQKEVEYINNNVEVVEVSEENQYYIKNAYFANLNKNNTLDRYKEEVTEGSYYLDTLKVTREIYFNDYKSLKNFSNMLLHDFDFIEGTGGSYTEDLRINSMTDYSNMSSEERKTVEWLLHGIAVYYNNELQFVIDAEGYGYSRYVGLIGENTTTTKEYDYKQVISLEEVEELKIEAEEIEEVYNNIVIEKNAFNYDIRKAVATAIKENVLLSFDKAIIQQIKNEEIKLNLYKVLKENDTIKDQFIDSNFSIGENLTIVRDSAIGGASWSYIEFNGHELTEEYQYKEVVKMTMKVNNKRGLYTTTINNKDNVLIYRGWQEIPQNLLYEDTSNENFRGTATLFGSYDTKAMDVIIEYLQEKNILPAVSTYKPVF